MYRLPIKIFRNHDHKWRFPHNNKEEEHQLTKYSFIVNFLYDKPKTSTKGTSKDMKIKKEWNPSRRLMFRNWSYDRNMNFCISKQEIVKDIIEWFTQNKEYGFQWKKLHNNNVWSYYKIWEKFNVEQRHVTPTHIINENKITLPSVIKRVKTPTPRCDIT